ncbi:Y4yA family PLP-dependent enzyme [Pectobacterium polaris]|uniref:Y4yA family PLP-dependent enzyme n=1 Tax=Pectobacterium polaris TaxID=2042057 RepID=A0AAW4NUF8_9GAMM|nr:Y4yA family PLP-dependent enzyme [Pectobacterium polaris]MBW5890629.1 Y4yA family PLP-dependent enzyme [Pectobacterium polaris]
MSNLFSFAAVSSLPVAQAHWPERLTPYLDSEIEQFVFNSPQRLSWLVEQYGSPLNIVWPHTVANNIAALRTVLQRHDVDCRLYYGAKVNKSPGLVQAAVNAGVGVDVSSLQELKDALRAGCDGARPCATGPAKTREFLTALVHHRALIVLDSPEEFDEVLALADLLRVADPVRVLLRYRPSFAQTSRFGMLTDEVAICLEALSARQDALHLEGFHFHLGGYEPNTRVAAFAEVLPLLERARSKGLEPAIIDIGGGLPIQYLPASRYQDYLAQQNGADYRHGQVPTSFYPYGGERSATDYLEAFLSASIGQDRVADVLKQHGLILAIEPGRSLADQSAITVFRVTRTRRQPDGNHVVFVEGSSFSACETWFNSEFLIDPLHVFSVKKDTPPTPGKAWIAGHSCLDDDVITNRLIHFRTVPQSGDLLIYANTAGYQMDLLENAFHRHPLPARLCAFKGKKGELIFSSDN